MELLHFLSLRRLIAEVLAGFKRFVEFLVGIFLISLIFKAGIYRSQKELILTILVIEIFPIIFKSS